jgi:raffinose/stachyose/melibiose transport system permease protein
VPALTICLFLSISNSLKSFDLVYAMVGPSGYATGTVPFVMDIFFDAFAKRLAGLATAKAMLLFLAIFLVTGIQLALMKRREVKL